LPVSVLFTTKIYMQISYLADVRLSESYYCQIISVH